MPKKPNNLLSHLLENKKALHEGAELSEAELEQQEDYYLSKEADALDEEGLPTYTHSEAWK